MNITARDINKHRQGQGHQYECVEVSDLGTIGTFICRACAMQMQGTIVDWGKSVAPANQVIIFYPLHFRRKGVYEWSSRWIPCPAAEHVTTIPDPVFMVGDTVEGPGLIDRKQRVFHIVVIEDTHTFAMGYDVENPDDVHSLRLDEMKHHD